MTPERYRQIGELYHAALEVDAAERAVFLARACADDAELRRQVESLINSHEQAADFIAAPALEVAAEMLAGDETDALTGRTIAHYRVLSLVGAGGMGRVYLAEDTGLGRRVALKLLPEHFTHDKNQVQRFRQEARAASALNHPNILTVHEVGQVDGTEFIVTEYVEGETLRERLTRAPFGVREALDVAAQVAGALVAAHAAGIVHRDVKPENVMLRTDGYVKVLDFGLAKLTEHLAGFGPAESESPTRPIIRTTPGVVMGTAIYMSPEQARGLQVDARTDIFSLGVLIYEMVAGRLPFEGSNSNEILASILNDKEPLPLARFAREVPAELERIVAKALRKRRDERYQTTKDLLLDLKALKQELEFTAKLERSAPRLSPATSSVTQSGATIDQLAVSTSEASKFHPTPSAEYLITRLQRHKLAAAVVLVAIAAAIAGLAAYLHARNTEVAIDSIAVLPFVNQNRDPDTEYLSDGLTESIINSLTQLPSLRVSPRSSVFQYKGKDIDPLKAARDLGVRAVLTGRMLQRGDNLMVSAELLDVRDNKQLWGEQYNRKLADALAVQQEISREISERLRTKLSGEDQRQLTRRDTSNPDAYAFYLKGRYYWNKRTPDNLRKAIEQFQLAADKDPNYALAYVGLADCYSLLEFYAGTPASETSPKAKAFAERALQLDNSLAEAHTSLGYAYEELWQWEKAEEEFKRALKLNPNYPTAHHWHGILLLDAGRFDEALIEAKRAQELDPLSLAISQNVSQTYLARGDVNSAIVAARKIIELDPRYPRGHMYLGFAYLKQGNYADANAELRKAVDLPERDRSVPGALGYGYAVSGRRVEALAILKELEEKYGRHEAVGQDLAAVYAGLGDKDQAFAWLEKDFQARSGLLPRVRWYVPYESLRSDPRYTALLRGMGLPQ